MAVPVALESNARKMIDGLIMHYNLQGLAGVPSHHLRHAASLAEKGGEVDAVQRASCTNKKAGFL